MKFYFHKEGRVSWVGMEIAGFPSSYFPLFLYRMPTLVILIQRYGQRSQRFSFPRAKSGCISPLLTFFPARNTRFWHGNLPLRLFIKHFFFFLSFSSPSLLWHPLRWQNKKINNDNNDYDNWSKDFTAYCVYNRKVN